ncbi:DUF6427 family protein [Aureivirga sp. CE67]|uniref:DUF6427 family protein n=1 Tax=Aureivirga sp. CE67 TaxID=1788983 RepID=UPI001E40FEEF|nr:DUF6427 family protein [Aureivirga sp. CE67]
MIANFFNKTKPINLLTIIFLLIVISIISFFKNISENYSFTNISESIGILLFSAVFLSIYSFVIKKNNLVKKNSYGDFLVILIFAMLPQAIHWNLIFISNFFLILFFRRIFSLNSIKNIKLKLFDVGFWLAISFLFFNWSIVFGILIYISLVIYERVNFRTLLIPIIGFSFPITLFYTYSLLIEQPDLFLNSFTFYYNTEFEVYNQSISMILPLSILGILALFSILITTPKIASQGNNSKYSWGILILSFLLSLVIIAFSSDKNPDILLFLIFPCATILANFVQEIRGLWIKESILYILIGCSIYMQYQYFIH